MQLLRVWEEKEVDKIWILVKDHIQDALNRSGGYADTNISKIRLKKI